MAETRLKKAANQSAQRSGAEVLVVGAGVIGLSVAWELSKRGAEVTVLDSGAIAGLSEGKPLAASWAGAGILPPAAKAGTTQDPFEQLKTFSMQLHPTWAAELFRQTGIDSQFSRCGGLHISTTPAEAATLVANRFWWDEHQIEYENWDAAQVASALPVLNDQQIKMACFLPGECQLRNPRHLKALVAACVANGVRFEQEARVVGLVQSDGGAIQGVKTESKELYASKICVCSGAWARQLLDGQGVETGLLPVRGQIVLYRLPGQRFRCVVNEGHRYLVPRDDGRVLAGSVEEEVGYRLDTTQEAIEQIRAWAEHLLPELRRAEVESSWAGLRPGSFDTFPYMGSAPECNSLFIAAGHFRSGLYLSPATAVCMADLIEGNQPPIDMHSFRVGRG